MSAHVLPGARRHTVRGGIFGFLFGLFVALDLFVLGVVASDSVLITILPVVGLVGGIVLGRTTPLGRHGAPAPARAALHESLPYAYAEPAPVAEPAAEPEPAQPTQPTEAVPEAQAAAPPGWYPTPGETRQRWWDGTQWTDHYA